MLALDERSTVPHAGEAGGSGMANVSIEIQLGIGGGRRETCSGHNLFRGVRI
jgi:hypothetical protein